MSTTEQAGSSLSRAARTQPAEPPPTTTMSDPIWPTIAAVQNHKRAGMAARTVARPCVLDHVMRRAADTSTQEDNGSVTRDTATDDGHTRRLGAHIRRSRGPRSQQTPLPLEGSSAHVTVHSDTGPSAASAVCYAIAGGCTEGAWKGGQRGNTPRPHPCVQEEAARIQPGDRADRDRRGSVCSGPRTARTCPAGLQRGSPRGQQATRRTCRAITTDPEQAVAAHPTNRR